MTFSEFIQLIDEKGGVEEFHRYTASGGDVNATHVGGLGLLHQAVEMCNQELIRALIAHGADINIRAADGSTPLHIAVDIDIDGAIQSGQEVTYTITQLMLSLGADEKVKNKSGEIPRDVAAAYGQRALALYDSVSQIDWSAESIVDRTINTRKSRQ